MPIFHLVSMAVLRKLGTFGLETLEPKFITRLEPIEIQELANTSENHL
jgi:hypothetical protein